MENLTIYAVGLTVSAITMIGWICASFSVKNYKISSIYWAAASALMVLAFSKGHLQGVIPFFDDNPFIFPVMFGAFLSLFHAGVVKFSGGGKKWLVDVAIVAIAGIAGFMSLKMDFSINIAATILYASMSSILILIGLRTFKLLNNSGNLILAYISVLSLSIVGLSYLARIGIMFSTNMIDTSTFNKDSSIFLLSTSALAVLILNAIFMAAMIHNVVRNAQQAALSDHLTGLSNRHRLEDVMETEMNRSRRTGHSYSVMIVDIDHFKKVNDTFGHFNGDKVLKQVADILARTARSCDTVGRLGGEEFCVVLPETNLEGAIKAAERFREAVQQGNTKIGEKKLRVTCSIGVASFFNIHENWLEMLQRSDSALYQAKLKGRNRVEFSDPNKTPDTSEPDDSYEGGGLQSISESVMEIKATQSSYDRIKNGNSSTVSGMQSKR